jgi:hypothetical protein
MKSIVRKTQSNFQFATIYEQRKTNQILVAGFTNLAQALEYMTQRISGSIGDLANSVDAVSTTSAFKNVFLAAKSLPRRSARI